jgi:DNA topoisomerase VI subunit A
VICIENVTPFYELAGASSSRPPLLPTLASLSLTRLAPALLCLWGNPSPACRRLLLCLAENLPPSIPLLAWNDLDYGGLNILAQLRSAISPRFMPYCMDIETLEAHASCASPLKPADRANLKRLLRRPELRDMQPVIEHMLRRGLKLEQEAIKMV